MTSNYQAVTISSLACSGATTLAQGLYQSLHWPIVNPVSQALRNYLREHGLPMSQADQAPDDLHIVLDNQVKAMIATERHKIFLGRTTGWLARGVPNVAKLFVTADQSVRITRYASRENLTLEIAKTELMTRDEQDKRRYQRLYGFDYTDVKWYDLTIDTSTIPSQTTLDKALAFLTT